MQKDKIIKISIVLIVFLLCGCLYSCKDNEKTVVSLEDNTEVMKEDPVKELESNTEATNEKETANEKKLSNEKESSNEIMNEKKEQLIYVYVCGEVLNPGVYQVEEGARMYQVIDLAGGVLETAADNYLNLAESVTDGLKIVVPTQEESEKLEVVQEEAASQFININTANEETLTTLPGIGASKAKSIISYRESKGGFTSIEELMEIEGIKEGVYNKVKDMITVN